MVDMPDKDFKTIILKMLKRVKKDVESQENESVNKMKISIYGKPKKKPKRNSVLYHIQK